MTDEGMKKLKDLRKEYELLAKYNGGEDYIAFKVLDMAVKELSHSEKPNKCFDGMTNGEVIDLLFPSAVIYHNRDFTLREMIFPDEWWNEPYKTESEEI